MIYAMHGVNKIFTKRSFCDQDFLDTELFKTHLLNRKNRYVSIEDAIEGKGDALTIDDSLRGGLEAATLCRKFGHEVSLFINPFNIEKKVPYWFSILNILLDKYDDYLIRWETNEYILNDFKSKLSFRIKLKNKMASLDNEEEKLKKLFLIYPDDNINNIEIPEHLSILSLNDLKKAIDLGISIHNHGWTHRQIGEVSHAELDQEILKSKQWIKKELNIDTNFYAVPFGKTLPLERYSFERFSLWFLNYNGLYCGKIGEKIYNRQSLVF
jgi:hypothetical protein